MGLKLVNSINQGLNFPIAMREQFLKENWKRLDEDNYEFKRRDRNDKAPNIEEINDQQKKKRLKTE